VGKEPIAQEGPQNAVPYGHYLLLKRLAVGGMAELYLAKDTRSGRMLVLKRILPYLAEEVEFVKMFLDEARIAAQLHHPNIVDVFELGHLDHTTFIAMEWVDGVDLRKVLQKEQDRGARLPPGIGAFIIARLCEGLHYAHQRPGPDGKPLGIIHRDVSPQNVMVSYRGDVKLVDFGIAKATAWMSRSKPGVIKGKFLYLSPEQLTQERLDHRSDLFALGALLYELTVGQSPFFRSTTEAVIYSIRMEDPPSPAEVVTGFPKTLSRIIMRCLEKDRERRYQTGDEVRAALDAFLGAEQTTSRAEVVAYIAELFGGDDERTAVFLPPNAQPSPGPSPFAEDENTASMPGVKRPDAAVPVGRAPTRDLAVAAVPARAARDVIHTAPLPMPESSPTLPPVADSDRALPPVFSGDSMDLGPTRLALGQPVIKTGDVAAYLSPTSVRTMLDRDDEPVSDPSISTVSQPPPRLLVPPPKQVRAGPRPSPPIAPEITGPVRDDGRLAQARVTALAPPVSLRDPSPPLARPAFVPAPSDAGPMPPVPTAPEPVRPSRSRRAAPEPLGRPPSADREDEIATVDMAEFEDSQIVGGRRKRAIAVVALILVAVSTLVVWALWPRGSSPTPAPVQVPDARAPAPITPQAQGAAPALVRVTFRGRKGTSATIDGVAIALEQIIELRPGPLTVRVVCPVKKPQKPHPMDFTATVPERDRSATIDLPCP
jgi:eukaryotic-like serine/threonine-protein kinase